MKPSNRYYTTDKFKYLSEKDRTVIAQEFDFLDTLDLYPILVIAKGEGLTIYKIMNYIEDIYENEYIQYIFYHSLVEDNFILNHISTIEFVDYLKAQYNLTISVAEDFYIE